MMKTMPYKIAVQTVPLQKIQLQVRQKDNRKVSTRKIRPKVPRQTITAQVRCVSSQRAKKASSCPALAKIRKIDLALRCQSATLHKILLQPPRCLFQTTNTRLLRVNQGSTKITTVLKAPHTIAKRRALENSVADSYSFMALLSADYSISTSARRSLVLSDAESMISSIFQRASV